MGIVGGGWVDLVRGGHAARSLVLTLGTGLHAIEVFVATTIMPSVVAELGGLAFYAWSTTLFVAASILGSALAVRALAAGPRRAYRIAVLIFAAGTLLCAVAPSMPVLLVGRAVQGLGGGLLVAFSYALIRELLPEPLWVRATGLIAVAWGTATLLGPALGGLFAQWDFWRGAFWLVLVIAAGFAALTELTLPTASRSGGSDPGRVPIRQLGLLTAAVLIMSAAGIVTSWWINAAGIMMAAGLLLVLVGAERRASLPILPHGALAAGSTLAPLYAAVALLLVGISSDVYAPYFLQMLHGQTPLASGYLTALVAVGWSAGAMLSASAGERGRRLAMTVGPTVLGVAIAGLAATLALTLPGSATAIVSSGALLLAMGLGIGSGWPHLVNMILASVPEGESERAGASITTVELLGSAVGAAAAGMLANLAGIVSPGGVEGTRRAAIVLLIVLAAAPVLAAAGTAVALRRRRSEQRRPAAVPVEIEAAQIHPARSRP